MNQLPDYHFFSSIGEYLQAINAVGLYLPVTACWLIQSEMHRRGCSFSEAMDHLTQGATLILLPRRPTNGASSRTSLPPIEARIKDLDG